MYILGFHASFNGNNHDPSACLMKSGNIISAIEEERLNRVKTSLCYFPVKSIKALLAKEKITIKNINYIATTGISFKNFHKIIENSFLHSFGYCPKILIFPHHLAHAAGSYYSSGFKKSLVISIDGMGDGISTEIFQGNNEKIKSIEIIGKNKRQCSAGNIYAVFTEFLGFTAAEGEYKVMGMAAYGKKVYNLDKLIKIRNDPFSIKANKKIFVNLKTQSIFQPIANFKYLNKFFKARSPNDKFKQYHFDLAKSIQKKYEEILLRLVKEYKNNNENICLSGGCALNSLANMKLFKEFKNVYIMPASSDRGLSVGAAFLANKHLKKENVPISDMFLGLDYKKNIIQKFLTKNSIKYKECNPFLSAAEDLKNGKVIGWVRGRSEFGPRALGARSILGLPSIKGMKNKINEKIKFREKYRPFAPVMLKDFAESNGILGNYDFMTSTIFAPPSLKKILKETIHKDGTIRIQTVKKKNHPLFNLLSSLKKKKLPPVLINTSFNLAGEPIVETPSDAIRTFYSSGLDVLYIEKFRITK